MIKNKNSASKEDYLETIYEFSQQNEKFKAVDIAKKLNISRASVSEAFKRLAQQGYITYENKLIILTDKGLAVAQSVLQKHLVLSVFFKDFLHLSEQDAQINACRIEHVITDSAFEKINELVKTL